MKLPFKRVYAFRPGFIKPTKGLRNAYFLSKLIGVMYPLWKVLFPKYVCTSEDLGLAMIRAATEGYPKQVVENIDIAQLAHSTSGGSAKLS